MTDILCNWLEKEVKLSRKVDPTNFAREFSTGYLIGEVLHKYQLQDDFDQFSQSRTSDSKLNNFTRIEPVLHLLGVQYDTVVARDIMTESLGIATRLMYQVYIAIKKKEKNNLTGVAMETMRPAAPVKLEAVESLMYKERLKHMTPRQTDLNLDALVSRFHEHQIALESTAFRERFLDQERHHQMLQDKRQQLLEKSRNNHARESEMLAKINAEYDQGRECEKQIMADTGRITHRKRAATVHIPKPPPNRTAAAIAEKRALRKQQEAQMMRDDIEAFDEKLKRTLQPSKSVGDVDHESQDAEDAAVLPSDTLDLIKPTSNADYINRIRNRLNEDATAREEREKRRRKVLVDQMKAHEAQEEARREEILVGRLMRQSQQERRIAVQLLHARHEKEVIRNNRLAREKEYQARRQQEFEEALNREAEMARLAKIEYTEQTKKDKELHEKLMAERAEARYQKHYEMSTEILGSILDYSTKVAEYRDLTNRLVPAKLMRDWTSMFIDGQPLYEVEHERMCEGSEPSPEQILEEERQQLLDEGDFEEYRNMVGEWLIPEGSEIKGPPRNNPIVGHIVQRLYNIVHPPSPPPDAPEFPPFPIKACVIGKTFAGKSSVCEKLAQYHRLQVLNVDELVAEAVEAHKNGEVIDIEEEEIEVTVTPAVESEMLTVANSSPGASEFQVESGGSKHGSAKPSELTADAKQADNRLSSAGTTHSVNKVEEGMEKTDPEKPVPEAEDAETQLLPSESEKVIRKAPSSQVSRRNDKRSLKHRGPPKPQDEMDLATPRAKLGMKAMKVLKKGKGVDDALAVDILVEAIRRLPENTGWILDSFPATYAQAKLLEKALSGFDNPSREPSKASLKSSKGKRSTLAPDPKPSATPSEPSSGINVVILFDLDNELCLKRSAGRTYATQADEQYHQEFKPPPEGSMTGVGKTEKVVDVQDPAYDQEQIQHRLASFQDAWPKLDKWFTKFGTLRTVDANQDLEQVFLEVEKILEDTLDKLMGKDQPEVLVVEEVKEEKAPEPEKPPEPPVEETVEEPKEDRSRPTSKKGSRAGSAKRSASRGDSADKKAKKSNSRSSSKDSGKKSAKSSRGSSPKSAKSRKSGKKAKTPEPEPEPEPEIPPGTPPPQPGSDEWEYVDLPVDEQLAQILAPNWDNVESTYIGNTKNIFRKVRDERDLLIKYFYQMRKDYLAYLRRPDHKQEFVSQWQQDFNDVSDELRDDEEMRAELHQQVDDLRERLWSICDERKEQAEHERETIMNDGWVEDHLGILSNHYITLMQAEVDRFQDTTRLLKDYYKGMDGKIPDELSTDFIRIPLVELPATERAGTPARSETGSDAGSKAASAPASPAPGDVAATDVKSVPSKAGTPSGKRGKKSLPEVNEELAAAAEPSLAGTDESRRPRIPLVPRRPVSPDATAAGAAKGKADKAKAKGQAGGKEGSEDGSSPPADLDEKLVYDAHQTGISAIDKAMAAEQAAREAEEEAEKEKEREKELEKQKAAAEAKKKGKKGDKGGKKSRSPSPKKGKGKDTPTQPSTPPSSQEEESEEDREKKKVKERGRQELMAACHEEANAAKTRLDLIRTISCLVLQDLKSKAEGSYADMNDWLGARFLKEMESIDQLSEVARGVIEEGSQLREELIIDQEDFMISEDVKVLCTPSPPPRPAPMEPVMQEAFTVSQITDLYNQFSQTAPSGMISLKTFHEIFSDVTSLTHGTEQIPDIWMNVPPEKLEQMGLVLSPDGEYLDWRAFLLQAAHPWPLPTQADLLQSLQNFKEMDQKNLGYVTQEQYNRVELWFKGQSHAPPTPVDPAEPLPYDRLENLKLAFFDLFADHSSQPSKLDYTTMLLYFSSVADPYEGFLRALSVAAGTHMPRLPRHISMKKSSRPASQASLVASVEMEGEEATVINEDIPESALHATVPLDALDLVLHHGQSMRGDSHRFSVTSDPEDTFSRERLAGVYQDLGSDNFEPVTLAVLVEHPIIQDILSAFHTFKAVDFKAVLTSVAGEMLDLQSLKAVE